MRIAQPIIGGEYCKMQWSTPDQEPRHPPSAVSDILYAARDIPRPACLQDSCNLQYSLVSIHLVAASGTSLVLDRPSDGHPCGSDIPQPFVVYVNTPVLVFVWTLRLRRKALRP